MFLLDNELSCINRKDRKLQWATRLPITSGGLSMLAGAESILVLTSRGVFQLDRQVLHVRLVVLVRIVTVDLEFQGASHVATS